MRAALFYSPPGGSPSYTNITWSGIATGGAIDVTSFKINGALKTFPSGAMTVARTDAGQTFAGAQIFSDNLTVDGGASSKSLIIKRGSSVDTTQNFVANLSGGVLNLTAQRTGTPLASAQTSIAIQQQGSDGTRDCITVDNAGNAGIVKLLDISGATAGQIKFPATQNPSSDANTLDDYEEGTFTPAFGLGGGSVTYTEQTGSYTKIGRQVQVQITLQVNVASAPSGALTITGLPFTASSGNKGAVSIYGVGLAATATTMLEGYVSGGTTTIALKRFAAGAIADMGGDLANSCIIQVTANYSV